MKHDKTNSEGYIPGSEKFTYRENNAHLSPESELPWIGSQRLMAFLKD